MSNVQKFKWGTWDIETFGVNSDVMQMIGVFDGDEYANFNRWDDFLAYIGQKKYHNWRWFAHNGGRFDTNALFDHLRFNRQDISFSFFCASSAIIRFTMDVGGTKVHLCDSYRLMDKSFHDLAIEFDVEHKKLDPDPTFSSIQYNRNDCLGLYEILDKFFGEYGITAETVASFALKVFRHKFLKRTITKPPPEVEAFVRKSYYGGRCEVYRWDNLDLNKYDVNSLYPRVMLERVPIEYIGASRKLPEDDDRIGFFRADIEYPELYLPALPVMLASRLFFPVGRFEGVFTSMELRAAIADGAAVKIREGHVFTTDFLFAEFVTELYAHRRAAVDAGNAAIAYVDKKVMNSTYGKFGQKRDQISYCQDPGTPKLCHPDCVNPTIQQCRACKCPRISPLGEPGSGIAYFERESMAGHILPHIASAITARARLLTRQYLRAAGRIWYTDTDSIFTDSLLPVSSDLGGLKLEGRDHFTPYGLKEYRFGEDWNIKGVSVMVTDPDTGKKVYRPEIAEAYIRGEPVHYRRRAGILESIRSGENAFRGIDAIKMRRIRMEKRARMGQDTRPWLARELEGVA